MTSTPTDAPFAQAFRELLAIVGPENRDKLKLWRDRWIDEAYACLAVDDAIERLRLHEKDRITLNAYRSRSMAETLVRAVLERQGVVGAVEGRPSAGGVTESRKMLCVVRAEPRP